MLVGGLEKGAPRPTALAHGKRLGAKACLRRQAHARRGHPLGRLAVERIQLLCRLHERSGQLARVGVEDRPREAGPGVAHDRLTARKDARGHGNRRGRGVRAVVTEQYRAVG